MYAYMPDYSDFGTRWCNINYVIEETCVTILLNRCLGCSQTLKSDDKHQNCVTTQGSNITTGVDGVTPQHVWVYGTTI